MYCVFRYRGVVDAVRTGTPAEDVGRRVILSPSFKGGPQFHQANYHDSMALVRACVYPIILQKTSFFTAFSMGKPCLFITMTMNPKCPEVMAQLLPGQQPHDRPDVIARVFGLKLKALINDLTKKMVLGVVIGKTFTIEFQKRGSLSCASFIPSF